MPIPPLMLLLPLGGFLVGKGISVAARRSGNVYSDEAKSTLAVLEQHVSQKQNELRSIRVRSLERMRTFELLVHQNVASVYGEDYDFSIGSNEIPEYLETTWDSIVRYTIFDQDLDLLRPEFTTDDSFDAQKFTSATHLAQGGHPILAGLAAAIATATEGVDFRTACLQYRDAVSNVDREIRGRLQSLIDGFSREVNDIEDAWHSILSKHLVEALEPPRNDDHIAWIQKMAVDLRVRMEGIVSHER